MGKAAELCSCDPSLVNEMTNHGVQLSKLQDFAGGKKTEDSNEASQSSNNLERQSLSYSTSQIRPPNLDFNFLITNFD